MIQPQNKIFSLKNPAFLAFVTALCAGVLVHLFALTNPLHNYDDLAVQPLGFGTGISSGRWLLEILGTKSIQLGIGYNLPTLNGLVFLFYLSLAAGFLVSALKLRSPVFSVMIGILVVVFPSTASTMYFRYTAPYYGLGILFAVMAAWALYRSKLGILYSAVLTGCSLGIYQAYTPITIGLLVLMLLQDTVSGEKSWKTILAKGLYDCAALVLGLAAYSVFLKITLHFYFWVELSDYQGIDQMGLISLKMLPQLIQNAFLTALRLPAADYCGIAFNGALRLAFLMTYLLSLLLTLYLLVTRVRNLPGAGLALALLLVFPLAAAFVIVMCPQSAIYTLMVYGFMLIPCVPAVLLEALPQAEGVRRKLHTLTRRCAALVLSLFLLFYAYNDNVSYTSLYYANRQAENYYTSLITQIRMTEGFTADKQWAFIGSNQDPLQVPSEWDKLTRYGGNVGGKAMITTYSWIHWVSHYLGYSIPFASEEAIASLVQTEEFQAMPCWPDAGSIKAIGDLMVIKYS